MMPMVSGLALPIPVPPVTGGFPYGAPIPGVSMVAPGVPGAVPGLSFAGAPGYPGLPGMQPAPFGLQPFAGARTFIGHGRGRGRGRGTEGTGTGDGGAGGGGSAGRGSGTGQPLLRSSTRSSQARPWPTR